MNLTSFLSTSWYFFNFGKIFFFMFYFFVRWYFCDPWSCVNDDFFLGSIKYCFHSNSISSVGYVFYFGYYISRLVGIGFLGLFGFRNFLNFLPFLVFNIVCFCEVSFLFTIMTCWFSCWTFMVRVPVWWVARKIYNFVRLVSFSVLLRFFFRMCCSVLRFFLNVFFPVWYEGFP